MDGLGFMAFEQAPFTHFGQRGPIRHLQHGCRSFAQIGLQVAISIISNSARWAAVNSTRIRFGISHLMALV